MGKYAFGVDIGGTTVKLGLFEEAGSLLRKWEIPTRTENGGAKILPDVAQSIHKIMAEESIFKEEVLGAGVGTPGLVDENGVVSTAVNLGWDVINIPQVLGSLLEVPVKAVNDANAAAFGEMWQGGGKGCKNMVAVTLGTGVGGGIIINGQILTGAVGAGGEIGHIHVEDNEEEVCGCGCKGCLEQYASATGIARLAKKYLTHTDKPSVLRNRNQVTAKDVFDGVKINDELSMEIAKAFGEYLGKGLAIVAAVSNPQVFVIGGGVSKAGEVLFEYIRPAYDKYTFASLRSARLTLAQLGNDAGIYGAAGLFLAK